MRNNRTSLDDKIFNFAVYSILVFVLIIVVYPLYFIVIASISNPMDVSVGKVVFLPRGVTLEGYGRIIQHKDLWIGYRNTFLYTVVGTFINLAVTLPAGYALSREDMPGRNIFTFIFSFTMFFSGGLIPTYLVVKSLNIIDTFWVMVILGAVSVWNMIIARTFFQTNIPKELREASVTDGCSDFRFFFQMVLPLSKAIIAVITIYCAVGHWNEFFHGIIYLRNRTRYPLQLFLREILLQNQFTETAAYEANMSVESILAAESMKYGVIIVASLPVLMLYPFLQKYFMKGVMVGAIKG